MITITGYKNLSRIYKSANYLVYRVMLNSQLERLKEHNLVNYERW